MVAMDEVQPLPDLGRLLLLNENVGGHATMHLHLYRALRGLPEVEFVALDVPPRSFSRRLAGLQIPGLSKLDADLAALRQQLALSSTAQRMLDAAIAAGPVGAIHAYSQHVALRSVDELRAHPSVVSTDAATAQNALQLPYRLPARFTPFATRVGEHFEAKVFGAATMVAAQSEWAAAAIRTRYGIADELVRVIPFGMMPPDPVERVTVDGPPEITFTGTSLARKGGETLLRAFRERLRGECILNLVTTEYVPAETGLRVHRDIRPGDRRLVELLARQFGLRASERDRQVAVLDPRGDVRGAPRGVHVRRRHPRDGRRRRDRPARPAGRPGRAGRRHRAAARRRRPARPDGTRRPRPCATSGSTPGTRRCSCSACSARPRRDSGAEGSARRPAVRRRASWRARRRRSCAADMQKRGIA